jgi:hypothetical protein
LQLNVDGLDEQVCGDGGGEQVYDSSATPMVSEIPTPT